MLKNLPLTRPLAVIDLETTGVNPQTDRIVEVSVLKIMPTGTKRHVTLRLNPGVPIPPEATAVHGITDANVAGEPIFADVTGDLLKLLDGCDLCGFNIRRFDLRVLHAEFQRAGMTFPLGGRAVIDPLQIFHDRERRDLAAAVQFYLGREHVGAHSAAADVTATVEILDAMLERYDDLPRGVADLYQHFKDPNEVDSNGCFTRVEGQIRFVFGKYRGQPLNTVARERPDYLQWMLGQDFFEDTLAGSVAVRLRAGSECPAEWQAAPLLSWLFAQVKECEDGRRASPRSTGQRRPGGWVGPQILWAVDLQEVTALLPGQLLPEGVTRVEWRVGRGKPIHPHALAGPRGRQIEESVSEPLPPADAYAVELVPSGGTPERTRWTISYPAESAVVLFHTDGRLVDAEDPDPLTPGRYLALVRTGKESSVRALRGFSLVEKVPVGPIGWTGWSGWSVEVCPGATVPGYRIADATQEVRWETDPPAKSGVSWLDACPVFLGELPRLRMEPAEAFRGAVVEVVTAGAGGVGGEPVYLTLGRDVPVHESGETWVANLNAVSQLKSRFGRFILKCQPAGGLDRSPLVLVFNRLPSMGLEYVPDPQRPNAATAVRVIANETQIGVVPGADTEVLAEQVDPKPVRFVVRSTNPESAPGVHARSRAADWEMRVRIGVCRAGMVSGQTGFQGWRTVPFEEIDLSRIYNGDRLRIEFHRPPVTENGRLVTRLPGRGELLVGESLDQSATPTVFEIPVHRWRDGFGIGSCGAIQVRGGAGWLDAARLVSSETAQPAPAVAPPAETWWQQLTAELDQSVVRGDRDTASELIMRCLEAANGPTSSPSASDLLPLAAARAALVVQSPSEWAAVRSAVDRLQGRDDLPEARILTTVIDIRGADRLTSATGWSLAMVEETEARLPNIPAAAAVRAECWYRLARSAGGAAEGCWRACADRAGLYLTADLAENGIAFSDALLLRDLARMVLGAPPTTEPVPNGVSPTHRGWIEAVRFATGFVRRQWHGRAIPEVRLDLTAAAPSVLCHEDAALLRVLVGIATGRGEPERHWPLVAGLPEGYFYALPLLRARYARYVGSLTADEEYAGAWAAFVTGDGADVDLLDVIAAERQ